MKKVKLTKGKCALVDDEDFEYLNQFKWHVNKSGERYYAARTLKKIKMHRIVMNTPIDMETDHINHNTLDNQKHNLRNVTKFENQRNRKCSNKNSTSKYLGVSLLKSFNGYKTYFYWQSQIRISGINKHLGLFKSEENAAIAYNIFAEKYYGQYSNLNKCQP